jgi:hypothetical protein
MERSNDEERWAAVLASRTAGERDMVRGGGRE